MKKVIQLPTAACLLFIASMAYCQPSALLESAQGGDARAQFTLGAKFERGIEVDRDDQEAVKWFRMAAEQGHALAQNRLGLMYASGRGVAQDAAQAARWLRLAAAQGDVVAQQILNQETLAGE